MRLHTDDVSGEVRLGRREVVLVLDLVAEVLHRLPEVLPGLHRGRLVADDRADRADGVGVLGLEVLEVAGDGARVVGVDAVAAGQLLEVHAEGLLDGGHRMLGQHRGAAVVVERPAADEREHLADEVLVGGLVLGAVELVVDRLQGELASVDAALAVDVVEVGLGAIGPALEQPGHRSPQVRDVAGGDGRSRDAHIGGAAVAARGRGHPHAAARGSAAGAPCRGGAAARTACRRARAARAARTAGTRRLLAGGRRPCPQRGAAVAEGGPLGGPHLLLRGAEAARRREEDGHQS